MKRERAGLCLAAGAGLLLAFSGFDGAAPGRAFPDGPPPAHTGGFGEPTCRACHFDHPLNDPAGGLHITGVPEHYVRGESYAITVTLRRHGLIRAGFELSARFAGGGRTGDQAGALSAAGNRVEVVAAGGVRYARQTLVGSRPRTKDDAAAAAGDATAEPEMARWTVTWTAPEPGGAIVAFHVTANAANGDASAFGDFIYAATARSKPRGG